MSLPERWTGSLDIDEVGGAERVKRVQPIIEKRANQIAGVAFE
jgi:hypothetical protein